MAKGKDEQVTSAPEDVKVEATPAADSPSGKTVKYAPVAAADNAQVGDDNVAGVAAVEVNVRQEEIPAQVTGKPAVPVETVQVHETYVTTDKVITDPNSPEAVQIPDAGRGRTDLPIHALSNPSPEQVFASQA